MVCVMSYFGLHQSQRIEKSLAIKSHLSPRRLHGLEYVYSAPKPPIVVCPDNYHLSSNHPQHRLRAINLISKSRNLTQLVPDW